MRNIALVILGILGPTVLIVGLYFTGASTWMPYWAQLILVLFLMFGWFPAMAWLFGLFPERKQRRP